MISSTSSARRKEKKIKEYLNGTALLHTLYDGEEISKEIIKCRVEIIPNSTARFLYTNSLIKENDVIIHNKIRYAVTKVIPYLVGGCVINVCVLTKLESFIVNYTIRTGYWFGGNG